MTYIRMLLVGLIAAASVAAADTPPPFGTVIQQWEMPDPLATGGLTWRRDSERFYLTAGGSSGAEVWSATATDPVGTLRRENWVFPNMGSATADIPWGPAWDNDSGCFWISNIVDGNIYGGCYYTRIRKSAVGDTWRWFSQNPGDTWLVGTGSGGGGGNMYFLGGSEKWFGRGYFIGAPLAPSPGPYNHLWKFDPYTKTSVGRCTNDTEPSLGITLVPWDSNYILTTSMRGLFKRDSTGLLLESVPGGPADIPLWIPQTIRPDDTVSFFMCGDSNNSLQRISVGMLWSQLPSSNPRNVRPLSILAPSGAIDSGQSITPRLVVQNVDDEPADGVKAYFTIDASGVPVYSDSLTNLHLGAWTTETLAFTDWTPGGRDTMSVIARTSWSGDSFPADDTIRKRFFVRVKDIAVPWFCADKDTYEQGDTVTVQGRVENRGNVTLRFDVNTWLADSSATRNLIMIPGGSTVVGYDPRQMPPGIYITGARAIATGDLVPGNNSASDTFVVRGPIDHDYAVLKILEPTGIKDTLTPIAPSTIIKNQGTQPDMAMVFFRIAGPDDSIVMFDSSYHMLAPGDSTPATFPEIRFSKFGRYTSACSVHMAGDQNNLNDKKVDTFEVAAVGVVADPKPAPARAFSLAPNPACDLVMVNLGPVSAPAEVSVYDVTGSAVRPSFVISTSSLRLDVRSMPPGLYFVRAASASRTQTAKLVVER